LVSPQVGIRYANALPQEPQNFAVPSRACPHSVQKEPAAGLTTDMAERAIGDGVVVSGYLRLIRQRPNSQAPNRNATSGTIIIPRISGEYSSDTPATNANTTTKMTDPNTILSRLVGGLPPLRRYRKY
jgi:hypothetical protein